MAQFSYRFLPIPGVIYRNENGIGATQKPQVVTQFQVDLLAEGYVFS